MGHRHSPGSTRKLTLGADKGYDTAEFAADVRQAWFGAETIPRIVSDCPSPPHVVQKSRLPAIDGRPTRHDGCALSRKHRKPSKRGVRLGQNHRRQGANHVSRHRKHAIPIHPDHDSQPPRPTAPPAGHLRPARAFRRAHNLRRRTEGTTQPAQPMGNRSGPATSSATC